MKQICGRVWLGRAKVTFTRIGAYFSYINFLLLIITFYSVTGYKYAPLWLFLIVSVIGFSLLGVFDYFVVLPSEVSFLNQQFVRHQNPIYDAVVQLRKDLEKDEENV